MSPVFSANFSASNGVPVVVPIVGGMVGSSQAYITVAGAPAAGMVTVEYQAPGQSNWSALAKMAAVAIVGGWLPFALPDDAVRIRLTFASLAAPVSGTIWFSDGEVPAGAFTGLRAITTQPYTEANVKNGLQYYLRACWPLGDTIPAGAAPASQRRIWMQTGAKPVIVKLRDVQFSAEELKLQLFSGPTGVAGGTALAINNYNNVNPVASTVQAKKNVTTVTDGVEFGGSDPEFLFGSANAPQRNPSAIPQGRERILPPNTQFIVLIQNTGTGDARVTYYLDWYEGAPDLPL